MAIRTKLLNGNNITRDTDFSKFIQTVSEPWVIEGFTVTASSVAVWQARVPCERTNGETLYALIYNTAPVSISGNGEVYILVNQTYIDDWELANEDGTGIATIQVGTTPSKNALKLATITGGVVTDNRNIIPKVWELKTYIQSLQTRMNEAEQAIDELEEQGAVDHLEEVGLVWELYALTDTLFYQQTPLEEDCIVDALVGDVDADKQIHIQRIANWVSSNKLKLKVRRIWEPTTWLVVEVRRWVQVTVTANSEAYWYGDDLVCSWSIPYSSIGDTYSEIEVSMNGQFGWIKWELLDVVVYQTGSIVSWLNHYAVACDSTQYSEAFSYVKVNGTTRTRSKLCPYCVADWFAEKMIAKVNNTTVVQTWGVWTFAKTSTNKVHIIDCEAPTMRVVANSIPCSLYSELSNYYDYLKVNYWINNTMYNWSASQDNKDLMTNRYNTATGTVNLWTKTLTRWDSFYIGYSITGWSWTIGAFTITYEVDLNKKWDYSFIPSEILSLWEQLTVNIFWIVDNEFYVWEEVATATTWTITPWNFVGYLQIGKYKIPYYT